MAFRLDSFAIRLNASERFIGGTKQSATKKAAGKTGNGAKEPAPKAAGISATIYDAIEKLMAGAKMTRATAFRQHAKQTGRGKSRALRTRSRRKSPKPRRILRRWIVA